MKNDELRVKNDELRVKNDEFCAQSDLRAVAVAVRPLAFTIDSRFKYGDQNLRGTHYLKSI